MSVLEIRLYEVLVLVRQVLGQRPISKPAYMQMMGAVRDGINHFLSVQSGCSTGRHPGKTQDCNCPKIIEKNHTRRIE